MFELCEPFDPEVFLYKPNYQCENLKFHINRDVWHINIKGISLRTLMWCRRVTIKTFVLQ